jgi:hypothetical protein
MNDQIHSIFESSLRVTSAPVSSTRSNSSPGRIRRTPTKMNGVFEIPLDSSRVTNRTEAGQNRTGSTARTNRTSGSKTPRPAWSQVQPKKSTSGSKKSIETPKPKQKTTEDFSKTKTIKKSPRDHDPRISVSQSFHIKNPDLIDSIIATGNPSRSPSEKSPRSIGAEIVPLSTNRIYKNEFERRDSSAAKIQIWWKSKQKVKSINHNTRDKTFTVERVESAESVDKQSLVQDREKIRKKLEKRKYSTRMNSAREAKKIEKSEKSELPKAPNTSRPYDPRIDDIEQNNVKFSARIQSSRRRKSNGKPEVNSPSPEMVLSPRSTGSQALSGLSGSPPNEKENQTGSHYQPGLYKETKDKDHLSSILSALGELERKPIQVNTINPVKQSRTDLKLAELEASLREIENSKKVKFKETNNIEVLHMKGEENAKMMNLIFDEKSIQSDHLEQQVRLLHSALKQQKDEHNRQIKEMEARLGEERKLLIENNSTQNKRQLSFIDQLIKDKQSLGRALYYN